MNAKDYERAKEIEKEVAALVEAQSYTDAMEPIICIQATGTNGTPKYVHIPQPVNFTVKNILSKHISARIEELKNEFEEL